MGAADPARIRHRPAGFVFQSWNLPARAAAQRSVVQPLIDQGVGLDQRRRLAGTALARVGLEDRGDHPPNRLFGGQRPCVAIARALSPSNLLADEPTGTLDVAAARHTMSLFGPLHRQGQAVAAVAREADSAARGRRVAERVDGAIARDFRQAGHERRHGHGDVR